MPSRWTATSRLNGGISYDIQRSNRKDHAGSEKSSEEPFIIYRDKDGGWHSDFTQNQHGNTFGWVKDAKSMDAYAVIFTGAYFACDIYPLVYDKVMSERLRMEFDDAQLSGGPERDRTLDVRLPIEGLGRSL